VEEFALADLLKDWQEQIGKQELGWGVPIELPASVPEVKWKKDYVLLRTVLQAMATYANPLPQKDDKKSEEEGKTVFKTPPPLKAQFIANDEVVTISFPIQSDAKAQKKNQNALRVAKELAPACQGVLVSDPTSLKLTLKR
jgi:hypothetical protein